MIIFIKDKHRINFTLIILASAILISFIKTPLMWDIARFLLGLALGVGMFRSEK